MESRWRGCTELKRVFGCIMATVALCITFSTPELAETQKANPILECIWNLHESLRDKTLISSFILLAFLTMNLLILPKRKNRHSPGEIIFLSLIALFWTISRALKAADSFLPLYSSEGQLVKSIICAVGFTCLLLFAFDAAEILLVRLAENKTKEGFQGLFGKHPFLLPMITITACWLPGLIISFPGYVCNDSVNQLEQWFGIREMSTNHPPIHTYVMGAAVQTGIDLTGDARYGIFLFVLVQMICLILSESYSLMCLNRWKLPSWMMNCILLFYCFAPLFSGYAFVLLKDVLYSAFFLLFMTEILSFWIGDGGFQSKRNLLLYIVGASGVLCFRNNGLGIVYPLTAILFFSMMRKRNKDRKPNNKTFFRIGKSSAATLALLLILILFEIGLGAILNQVYSIQPGSKGEMFSLPFQQTARYVKYWRQDVTEEEKKIIDDILEYDTLGERYNPRISDPVKGKYKANGIEGIKKYAKVWLDQFFRHPLTYFGATMHQNYYILYPETDNDTIYSGLITKYYPTFQHIPAFESIQSLEKDMSKQIVIATEKLMFSVPGLSFLCNLGAVNTAILLLAGICLKRKLKKVLVVLIPILLCNIMIVFGPVIPGHLRYAFPILYSFPSLVGFSICAERDKQVQIRR